MKEFNNTSLRETLEQLPTPELDAMLRAELEKEPPDEHAVRLILKVLRDREADYPVETNERVDTAWREYEKKTSERESRGGTTFLKAATILIVCGLLLFTLPQEASAGSFFDRITAWTESIFELFSPSNSGKAQKEYVFRTDHPGLQELYDTVTELGVTVPVVPMWLDEGYELVDCKVINTPATKKVLAIFLKEEKEIVFELNIYSQNIAREYHKNEPDIEAFESNGVFHNIFRNEGLWTVVWARDNIECSIVIDCQEDILNKILDSIYTLEE